MKLGTKSVYRDVQSMRVCALLSVLGACRPSEAPVAEPEPRRAEPLVPKSDLARVVFGAPSEPPPPSTKPVRPSLLDPRGTLVPCTGATCGVVETDGAMVYFEQSDDGTPLHASEVGDWACFDAVVVVTGVQIGQCFHRVSECETARIEMASNPNGKRLQVIISQKCFGSQKAACSFGTQVLKGARMPSCWSNFAACEMFARELGALDGRNWRDLTTCEALLPNEWR